MTRITMTTLAAGPAGFLRSGHTYSVDDELARGLIAGGYAQPAEPVETQPAETQPAETQPAEPVATDWLPDRLSTIRGIGDRIEEALNSAGVWTFQQLADADADSLAAALDGSSPAQVRKWQADAIVYATHPSA